MREGGSQVDSQVTGVGCREGLRFELRWSSLTQDRSAAAVTQGELTGLVADSVAWGAEENGELRGLEWTWIELLEHLARAWRFLEHEQLNPLGISALPDELRVMAQRRWLDAPGARRSEEERLLYEYEESHNLAAGVAGLYPPPVWIQREGGTAWIVSDAVRVRRPLQETLDTLAQIGEAISDRVALAGDARCKAARRAWRDRGDMDATAFVQLATGLSQEFVSQLTASRDLETLWEVREPWAENEILAAARMIGTALPRDVIRRTFDRIRKVPPKATPELDRLAAQALKLLDSTDAPHDQGTATAAWLRSELGVSENGRVDPDAVLAGWDVAVVDIDLRVASINAIGCWGPRHGPVVFVNPSGRNTRHINGLRATLAHEICHLLLDRATALPLAEVVDGRVPPMVEQRARAFAAQLLIPKAVAAELAAVGRQSLPKAVGGLARKYGASREIVAWQARNSRVSLSDGHVAYLRSLVSDPLRF